MSNYRKATVGIGLAAYSIFLSAQLGCIPAASAQDSSSSLTGSNFGSVLPQGRFANPSSPFFAPSPFTEKLGVSPESSFEGQETTSPVLTQSAVNAAASASDGAITNVQRAWYKFLEPSLNLTRALEDAEHKRILSVVPMPLNIRGGDRRTEIRTALLRADSSLEYSCFKTIYGSLFGRSNSLIMNVSGNIVRVFNISGKDKDVLFKLSNGQIIALGPGTELIISKSMDSSDLNVCDGLARRGFTKVMKCADLQMGFAQFSYASVCDTPEMKFYLSHQSPKIVADLKTMISKIEELRGTGGFKLALLPGERHQLQAEVKKKETAVPKTKIEMAAELRAKEEKEKAAAKAKEELARLQQSKDEAKQKEIAKVKSDETKQKEIAKAKAEEAKQKEIAKAKAEEAKQKEIAKAKAEEAKQKEIAKAKAEEAKQKEIAKAKAEEAKQKEIAKAKAEEAKQKEIAKAKAEEAKQKEIAKAKAEEAKQKEIAKAKAEEAKQKEIAKAKAEEAKQKEIAKAKAEEAKQKEIARLKAAEEEAARLKAEEEKARKIAEAKEAVRKAKESARARAEELKQKEIALAKEEARQAAEAEKQKELAKAKEAAEKEKLKLAKAEQAARAKAAEAQSRELARAKEQEAAAKLAAEKAEQIAKAKQAAAESKAQQQTKVAEAKRLKEEAAVAKSHQLEEERKLAEAQKKTREETLKVARAQQAEEERKAVEKARKEQDDKIRIALAKKQEANQKAELVARKAKEDGIHVAQSRDAAEKAERSKAAKLGEPEKAQFGASPALREGVPVANAGITDASAAKRESMRLKLLDRAKHMAINARGKEQTKDIANSLKDEESEGTQPVLRPVPPQSKAAVQQSSAAANASEIAKALAEKLKEKQKRIATIGGKVKENLAAKAAKVAEATKASAAALTPKPVPSTPEPPMVADQAARKLLPRRLPGPDTPPAIARLLLDADKEEKTAIALRKKADKCIAYAEGGMMNYDQQKLIMAQAREHLKRAAEAEERSQNLRRQAELADNGKPSM